MGGDRKCWGVQYVLMVELTGPVDVLDALCEREGRKKIGYLGFCSEEFREWTSRE